MNKKIGLGILALIAAVAIYYFTLGKSQIVDQMKTTLHQELTTLQSHGFKIEDHKDQKEQEHFILSFDDPQKVAQFLQQQGVKITPADAQKLKGFKIAVDLVYLPDTQNAVAMDLYPVALPESITKQSADMRQQKLIAHLQDMLKRKAILLHLAVDKLGSHISGSMKDINETIHDEQVAHLMVHGATFTGDLKEKRLSSVQEKIKAVHFDIDGRLQSRIEDIQATYTHTGQTPYDYTLDYTIGKISIQDKKGLSIQTENIDADSLSQNRNNLLHTEGKSHIQKMAFTIKNEAVNLEDIVIDFSADNLDIQALQTLKKVDVHDKAAVDKAMQTLLSKGVILALPHFSVAKITKGAQTMEGFDLGAKFAIDKGFNVAVARQNPLMALDKVDAEAHLLLSNDLFAMIAAQPQAMMILMLFPPQEKNGKKSYTLELKKGKLLINGKPVM
ncbi:MAG: hypothetical protein DSZ10_02765 [Sulfurovum sp.]|nr:MAG: hypothetical protein DSZ10_02765 [Sulfurovum sp.]